MDLNVASLFARIMRFAVAKLTAVRKDPRIWRETAGWVDAAHRSSNMCFRRCRVAATTELNRWPAASDALGDYPTLDL